MLHSANLALPMATTEISSGTIRPALRTALMMPTEIACVLETPPLIAGCSCRNSATAAPSSPFTSQTACTAPADETSLKIRGQWVCRYRAVDRDGNIVDFWLSRKRDETAAKAFFHKALKT